MTALSPKPNPNPFQWDFLVAVLLGATATILAVALDYPDPWRIVVVVVLVLAGACAVLYDRRRRARKPSTTRGPGARRRTDQALRLSCACGVCRSLEVNRPRDDLWVYELPTADQLVRQFRRHGRRAR
jgi:hypothetical protein